MYPLFCAFGMPGNDPFCRFEHLLFWKFLSYLELLAISSLLNSLFFDYTTLLAFFKLKLLSKYYPLHHCEHRKAQSAGAADRKTQTASA